MRQIRIIRFRYSHHSPHSGYSRIAEYGEKLLGSETIPVKQPLPRWLIRERLLWKLAEGTPGYTREAMAAELNVARRALAERDCIYHFLYGETNYHYAGQLNGVRGNRIVATFHLPPANLQKVVQIDWHLRQLAAILCVGSNQIEYFAQFLDRSKLHFAPLGVDVEYYQPPADPAQRDPDLCIVIGENYRDFPTLRGVIELVAYRRPATRFVCVMPPKGFPLVGTHPNLDLRTGISEDELLNLYQTASLMVMPLHDATANNAVLESMACGVPMAITDVGAVRDYVSPQGAELLPVGDARRMADAVIDLLAAPSRRAEMGAQARQQALQFAWPKVIEQLKATYASIP
jgi:glycosyltransferase involved in cell wall biosynthesis